MDKIDCICCGEEVDVEKLDSDGICDACNLEDLLDEDEDFDSPFSDDDFDDSPYFEDDDWEGDDWDDDEWDDDYDDDDSGGWL